MRSRRSSSRSSLLSGSLHSAHSTEPAHQPGRRSAACVGGDRGRRAPQAGAQPAAVWCCARDASLQASSRLALEQGDQAAGWPPCSLNHGRLLQVQERGAAVLARDDARRDDVHHVICMPRRARGEQASTCGPSPTGREWACGKCFGVHWHGRCLEASAQALRVRARHSGQREVCPAAGAPAGLVRGGQGNPALANTVTAWVGGPWYTMRPLCIA